jgi:hypothetical protein
MPALTARSAYQPKGDGGGTFEVAGVNDRDHPFVAAHLRTLIKLGQHADAETMAVEYAVATPTAWPPGRTGLAWEAYLRGCTFNRGPGIAAKIFQTATTKTATLTSASASPKKARGNLTTSSSSNSTAAAARSSSGSAPASGSRIR